jgi:hypothetical protein
VGGLPSDTLLDTERRPEVVTGAGGFAMRPAPHPGRQPDRFVCRFWPTWLRLRSTKACPWWLPIRSVNCEPRCCPIHDRRCSKLHIAPAVERAFDALVPSVREASQCLFHSAYILSP